MYHGEVIKNNQSPQNTPIDPSATANQHAEDAKSAQEQFIPQVETATFQIEESDSEANRDRFFAKNLRIIQKIVVWTLTAQSLFNIYKSISFILVELPKLELQLGQNIINQADINGFASKAILMTAYALISISFAIKLSKNQSRSTKQLQTIIGIILVIVNVWLTNFLNDHQSGKLIGEFFVSIFSK